MSTMLLTIALYITDPDRHGIRGAVYRNNSISFSYLEIEDPSKCDPIGKILSGEQYKKAIEIAPRYNWKVEYTCTPSLNTLSNKN